MTDYQIATDPTGSSKAAQSGSFPVLHITAVGDATPLCGRDDLDLTDWSDVLTEHAAGRTLIAPDHPICGNCADEFWMACDA